MINVMLLFSLYLGVGLLVYSKLSHIQFNDNKAKFIGESFLMGVLISIFASNLIQLFHLEIKPAYLFYSFTLISVVSYLLFIKSSKFTLDGLVSLKSIAHWQYMAFFLVILHLYLIVVQSNLLPLTPWDAWYGWIAKAKVWVYHGLNEPLLPRAEWLIKDINFTNPTSHYPDGLSLLYYINSGLFGWTESALNAIYPALFISLILIVYGNIFHLTNDKVLAWIAVLLLVTIPFINIHITLAGYADIWVATYLFLLVITAQNFLDDKSNKSLLVLLIYSLGILMFKLESWVWLIGIYLALLFSLMQTKTKWIAVFFLIVIFIVWLLAGGFSFSTSLGKIAIQPDLIQLPMLGTYELSFSNTSKAWLESLFFSTNWSLLWFSVPFVIFMFFSLKEKSQILFPAIYLLYASLFLFILFYMTGASVWANDFTSSNRIVLHIVPVYIYLLIRIFQQWQIQKNPD